jgi:hypothetical protein
MVVGTEVRVSPISVPTARTAKISNSGQHIAVQNGNNSTEVVLITKLPNSDARSTIVPYRIEDFAFTDTDQFVFTEIESGKLVGKQLNPDTNVVTRLFTIPFTAATIKWGMGTNTPHYVYTTPAPSLMGYGYVIQNGTIVRLPHSGTGLQIIPGQNSMLVGKSVGKQHIAFTSKRPFTELQDIPVPIDPASCIATPRDMYYCAFPLGADGSDQLWSVTPDGAVSQLIDLAKISGQMLEVENLQATPDNKTLYFLNGTNRTLWAYTPA